MSLEENKALVRRAAQSYAAGDTSNVDELYAPDFVDHNAQPGTPPGREGIKAGIAAFHQAFPDLTYTLEDLIAEGDRVVDRGIVTGTHLGPLFGMPPTGKRIRVEAIDIFRIANGKIAEWWHQEDDLGLFQQLGLMPPGQGS